MHWLTIITWIAITTGVIQAATITMDVWIHPQIGC